MTAEEIYPLIDDNDDSETLDKHAYDQDNQSQSRDGGMRENDLRRSRKKVTKEAARRSGNNKSRTQEARPNPNPSIPTSRRP